ncbi:hypothetical protein ACIQWS_01100 [Phyllobacterium sp. NPDC097923]|uniref:hypothetical protein n=1 Tax=Phyllobacterium sp. NPDC097923 TaxID=3364404 RepID=UPI00383ADD4B
MVPILLNLDAPETWPVALRSYLTEHYDLLLGWEIGEGTVAPGAFDDAMHGLMDALLPYAITGWHCTRLTDVEIDHILRCGMQLPDAAMLDRRIDALEATGQITDDVSRRLKVRNQSSDPNRAGRVWFCFFPPRIAGEHGIERFFRHWGGEALYNLHEDDPITSPAISGVGTPCIVEADVPVVSLEVHGGLSFKIAHRFLASRGFKIQNPIKHEDRIKRPLAAESIRRIVRFPDAEFCTLTGCSEWSVPIGLGARGYA